MGHSSIQITVDIYGHLIPGANVTFVDKLDIIPENKKESSRGENAPPDLRHPDLRFSSSMVSADPPVIALAYQTTMEPLRCPIRTPVCRHGTCGLRRLHDSSAFHLALWKNIAFTGPVPPTGRSGPVSSTRWSI